MSSTPGGGTPDLGGWGAGEDRRVQTTRLVQRALKAGWDVPPEVRAKVTARLVEIVGDKTASRREATSAADSLMRAAALDQHAIDLAMRAEAHADLKARLDALEAEADRDK